MRTNPIIWLIMFAAAVTPASAVEHYAISANAVAETVSRIGVSVSADQITFPAAVVATTPVPALRIRSVEKLGDDRLLARLECMNSDECLPFFVDVHVRQGSEAQIATIAADAQQYQPSNHARGGALAVRSGSMVTLMLDGDHVHIRMQAICLQGGSPGQTIRVTDTKRRLVYQAQVVDASIVKGRLK